MAKKAVKDDSSKKKTSPGSTKASPDSPGPNKKGQAVSSPAPQSSQSKKKTNSIPKTSVPNKPQVKKRTKSLPNPGPSPPPKIKNNIDRSMSEPTMLSSLPARVCPSSSEEPIPITPKLNKRFYEALVMMDILGKNSGDRIKE